MKLHLASLILSSFLSTMFVGVARADDACTCAADGAATVLETTSRDGRVLKLRFDADPVTTATDAAHLCVDPAAVVTRAKLWMPSMGHGSSPTRLSRATDSCTVVERINFLMDGDWEVQVTLAGGDAATFALIVVGE